MTVTEALCTGSRRYKAAEPLVPRGVVLHSIATPQPRARVLRDYWQRDASPYVVHYVVDDQEILHCMPDHYKCWHVGSPGNARWLGVELCEPSQIRYTGGASFTVSDLAAAQAYAEAVYRNAVSLLAQLCTAHGWDPFTAVYTHREVTRQRLSNTDHVDPEHLWDGLGLGKTLLQLRRDVARAMEIPAPAPAPAPAPVPAPAEEPVYRVRKTWEDGGSQIGAFRNLEYAKAACPDGYTVFDPAGNRVWPEGRVVTVTAASGLNVRSGPGTIYAVVTALEPGGAWTIVEEQGGWGRLKSGAGWICLKYTKRIA